MLYIATWCKEFCFSDVVAICTTKAKAIQLVREYEVNTRQRWRTENAGRGWAYENIQVTTRAWIYEVEEDKPLFFLLGGGELECAPPVHHESYVR